MTAFALTHRRDRAAVDRAALEAMLDALAHRGPDGRHVRLSAHTAIGCQSFWTTPEAVGERQPLTDPEEHCAIAFDGRLDNRSELLAALDFDATGGRSLPDAALTRLAYARWGERCFERLLGAFAVAIHDRRDERIVLARDQLGNRTLFYYVDPRQLVVASEEAAIVAHPAVPDAIDAVTMAHFMALRLPAGGATFFAAVRELLPAHVMVVEPDRVRTRRYWDVDPEPRLRYRTDAEYAVHFRELLQEAVHCRMRAATPVGVMMSGGLDSPSVAALAARRAAARLRTFSFVFDELASCDERIYMDAMIAKYGLDAVRIAVDGDWPLRDAATWPRNPNMPDGNPFRRVTQRVYETAHERGTRVILDGLFSDHMYSGELHWLADLLAERRLVDAGRSLLATARRRGPLDPLIRGAVRRALGQAIGRRARRVGSQEMRPVWLTQPARDLLQSADDWPPSAAGARRPDQHESVLGLVAARSASAEIHFASRAGVELRHPFRDRRLVEFMLSIPAHQLYRNGRYKYILRAAMGARLPAIIQNRRQPNSLVPFFYRGIAEREAGTVQAILAAPEALWRRYVRPEWLLAAVPAAGDPPAEGLDKVVLWHCISAELWRRGVLDLPPAACRR